MVGKRDASGEVLGPAVAGAWYPAERSALERQIDGFLRDAAAAQEETPGPPARTPGLIAPHAGFVYSGRVAARGFARLGGDEYRRVVLLGPSHYAAFPGAVLSGATVYRTPLGDVPIDTEACAALSGRPGFRGDDRPFRPEHCLEAEIPFLQRRLRPGWRLLPVLVGTLGGADDARRLADGLRPYADDASLVVVSSDFTHYGPRFHFVPFRQHVPRSLERLDLGAVERILARDADGFDAYVERTGATICGRNPIRVLLDLLPPDVEGELAAYDTSGRITGEWDHSVSYASLVFRATA